MTDLVPQPLLFEWQMEYLSARTSPTRAVCITFMHHYAAEVAAPDDTNICKLDGLKTIAER